MPTQPQPYGDPERSRYPRPAPDPSSPYARPLVPPRKNTAELPPGYSADLRPPVNAAHFIGGSFAQDSQAFLIWLAVNFNDDLPGLRVVIYLMGSQEVGGTVKRTQAEIAKDLNLRRPKVAEAMSKIQKLGLMYRVQNGVYQLQPAVTLRGGQRKVDPGAGTSRRRKAPTVSVDQLSLLSELAVWPGVPDVFRNLTLPGARLPELPSKKANRKEPEAQ